MRSSTTLMAITALSIGKSLASPAHAHLHRDTHEKRNAQDYDLSNAKWDDIDWKAVGVDWEKVDYSDPNAAASTSTTASSAVTAASQPSATTSAASTASAQKPAASSQAPSGSGDFTGLFENLWHDVRGCSNDRSAFGGQSASSGTYVSYISNVGVPYGGNMMIVDSADKFDYTMTFVNAASDSMTVNCWNKPGMDGQANSGATDAPKKTTLTFNLDVGQSAIVAVDENTVLSCCESVNRFHSSGAFATTWVEAKFKKNDSGFDVSKILNTGPDYKVSMCAKETDCCSTETQNNWITESDTTGSGSCYIPSFGAHLTIKMSGTA